FYSTRNNALAAGRFGGGGMERSWDERRRFRNSARPRSESSPRRWRLRSFRSRTGSGLFAGKHFLSAMAFLESTRRPERVRRRCEKLFPTAEPTRRGERTSALDRQRLPSDLRGKISRE